MKRTALTALSLLVAAGWAAASGDGDSSSRDITFHGSVQSDILVPQTDAAIGAGNYGHDILTNTYADAALFSRHIDAGLRLEFLKWPLPGFEPAFKGWGIGNIYARGHWRGIDVTVGDFYEQFGSGFILRTYEERALGIDNSLRGARIVTDAVRGLRLTALGGVQRCFWSWQTRSKVYGADAEVMISDYFAPMRERGTTWSFGASYVLKHEKDETIIVPGTNYRLGLPERVNAVDIRSRLALAAGFNILAEWAWKSQDPSLDNNYTYHTGNAFLLSASYSGNGFSALLQAKRSENMSFRSRRSQSGIGAFINNLPAFTYQQTYSLAALYPYATQAAPGEWGFQSTVGYHFRRGTALGGRYGTKAKLNVSYIRGLHHDTAIPVVGDSPYGTEPSTKFFGMGECYYHDINIQVEKRFSRPFSMSLMYMNQLYNKTVIEGHGGRIKANIFVADAKYKFTPRVSARMELQYLTTRQDQKDWAYGLAEVSVAPYLMFSLSDMWNCGDTGTHYYMGAVTGNYRSNRLQLSYGRTRAGFNCSGGVCRYVPALKGFQVSYSYNF